jgi:hypothetical protein
VALSLRITTSLFLVLACLVNASAVAADTLAQAATSTPTPKPVGTPPTPIPCVVPKIGVHIELENPQPYDTLITGTQVNMNGIAFDTGATSGSGISQVSIYLGSRDAGGTALGNALLGQPNPEVPAGSQFANAGFTLRTSSLPNGSGGRSIFVYAKSSAGNAEGVLQVPIYLNVSPTPVKGQVPTPVLPTPAPCTPTPTSTPTTAATATPAAVAPSTPLPTVPATPTPLTVATLVPVAPAAPAAPAAGAGAPAAAPAPAASPVAAQTTAPRGGGIPSELGLIVLAVGAVIVGGGLAIRRRERRR